MWRGSIKLIKYGFLVFLLGVIPSNTVGQGLQIKLKYVNDSLLIRWIIENPIDWEQSINEGFTVKKSDSAGKLIEQWSVKHLLKPYLEMDPKNDDSAFAAYLLLKELIDPSLYNQSFPGELYSEEQELTERKAYFEYLLSLNLDISLKSGFTLLDTSINSAKEYSYTIQANNPDLGTKLNSTLVFNSSTYKEPSCPGLKAQWGNKLVELSWLHSKKNTDFFAYAIGMKVNNEIENYIDSLIIPTRAFIENSLLPNMKRSVLLENNDIPYSFSLRGRDFFGQYSECYSEITGSGRKGIGLSPSIISSKQLPTNEVELEWMILDEFQSELSGWSTYVAQNYNGPYQLDSTYIEANTRKITRPIPFRNSYFRIVALDQDQNEYGSFPQLVINYDTVAPEIPSNIQYKIDTNGIVQLNWNPNFEGDFAGYKVFFGFDSLSEMTLAHKQILKDPFFIDTIGLNSTNEKIYYKIISVDNRNNRSLFSDIIEIQKPDVLAPVQAHIYLINGGPGSAYLQWHPSSSKDVVNQKLFRRAVNSESDWTLIKEWQGNSLETAFTDSLLNENELYAYFILLEDDAGNVSDPSSLALVETLSDHRDLDLENWDLRLLDNGNVRIRHNWFDPNIYEVNIFKTEENAESYLLARLSKGNYEYIDKNIETDKRYSFFVQVQFEDGFLSPYSKPRTIE